MILIFDGSTLKPPEELKCFYTIFVLHSLRLVLSSSSQTEMDYALAQMFWVQALPGAILLCFCLKYLCLS